MEANLKLEKLLAYFETNKNKLGQATGKRQTFYDISKGQIKSFSAEVVAAIKKVYPSINERWFLYDEGEMIERPDKKTDALQQLDRAKKKSNGVHEANRDEGIEIDIENVHSVRAIVIPVKGQAGLQAHYFDEVLFKDLDTEELLTTEKHLGKYFKIEVQGESMDDGTSKGLQPGDWAYCRSVPKQYWREKLYTHKWRIWCFFHNERGIIFKSIVSHDIDTGEMVLESLNPNKALYPNFRINIGECSYVCNVVKKLSPL